MKTPRTRPSGLEIILWVVMTAELTNATIAAVTGSWSVAGHAAIIAALAAGWALAAGEARTWREVAAEREQIIRSAR